MINVNLPEIPKEAAVYVVAAVVGAVLIFGVWSVGVAAWARSLRASPAAVSSCGDLAAVWDQLGGQCAPKTAPY